MTVQSNILDPIHDELPADVWDNPESPKPKLKEPHRKWIQATVASVLAKNGYTHADRWLSFVLTGSLTTYQYGPDSDVDVSLFVDSSQFPEWSRAEMIGLMVSHVDGKKLPGTRYPMQCYVVPAGLTKEELYKPGLRSGYDLTTGEWIIPPEPGRAHDVEKEQNYAYVYALEQADKMDRLLRYEPEKAVQFWHQIHRRRQLDQRAGKGDYALSNIVYKFLANRGLFPQIAELSGEYIAKSGAQVIYPNPEQLPLGWPWGPGTAVRNAWGVEGEVKACKPEDMQVYVSWKGAPARWQSAVGLEAVEARHNFVDGIRPYSMRVQRSAQPVGDVDDLFYDRIPVLFRPAGERHRDIVGGEELGGDDVLYIGQRGQTHDELERELGGLPEGIAPARGEIDIPSNTFSWLGKFTPLPRGHEEATAELLRQMPEIQYRPPTEEDWRFAAGQDRQVAKFVYDPIDNRLVIGPMGREEGERQSHDQLLTASGISHDHAPLFGQVGPTGHVETFGRPLITGFGQGPMNQYEADWRLQKALESALPGVAFSQQIDLVNPRWEQNWTEPEVQFLGDRPTIDVSTDSPTDQGAWTFA